jgi:homoserine O-acetyltransferase
MVDALAAEGKDVSYCNIESPYGHDAFLLEPEVLGRFLCCFLSVTHGSSCGKGGGTCFIRGRRRMDGAAHAHRARVDYELIGSLIEPGSRVLDVGCGDGELLARLVRDKRIEGEGIELEQEMVLDCVCRGLQIIQQDVEHGLEYYADKSFDYAILSQTVQTVRDPRRAFLELLRVGKKVIVSFPNFAYWKCRLSMMFAGKAPVTQQLPFGWYDSPNIHFLSLRDFDEFCEKLGVRVEKRIALRKGRVRPVRVAENLLADQAVYVTSKA